jgi:SAM-dependent methyltransferase
VSPSAQSDPGRPPPLETQQEFWDGWNQAWRFRDGLDAFMERQRETAVAVAAAAGLQGGRILDVGCGTGWLGNALLGFGKVWATDLSPGAIAEGRKRHPGVQLLCGDFLELDLPGPFDMVVSADSLAHMYDAAACVRRIADLLRPGGTFLLMTQSPFIWERRSKVKPLGDGQIQVWPSLARCKALLRPSFTLERVTSLDPGGDRGLLWWVENRWIRGGMGRLVGRVRWRNLLERLRLGREMVIVARRS